MMNLAILNVVVSFMLLGNASCFAPPTSAVRYTNNFASSLRISETALESMKSAMGNDDDDDDLMETQSLVSRRSMVAGMAAAVAGLYSQAAMADEYGRETEMAFLSTGETVMICTKRGPLGRCEKTERRTAENENDKSEKYFRQPTELVKRKDSEARTAESSEGNILIERLKKQSEENSEKNELLVYQRTLMNDSVSGENGSKVFVVGFS